MTKAYKVAGHVFHLEISDTSSIWARLGQYDPFEVEPVDEPLFSLKLSKSLPECTMTPVYEGSEAPGETVVRLYRTSGGDWVSEVAMNSERPVAVRMMASADFGTASLNLLCRTMSEAVFGINNALMLLYAFRTAPLGTLEMHASVIRCREKAFLFLAKSGTGKSTHSQLWLDNVPGSDLLNDDNPIVRAFPDGRLVAYGSPWSGKTPCYRNIECPVGAFVQIRRCSENRITPLSLLESYALLYSSCSGFKSDSAMADALHSSLEAAVTRVPCYVLDCRPDAEAAAVCSSELLK